MSACEPAAGHAAPGQLVGQLVGQPACWDPDAAPDEGAPPGAGEAPDAPGAVDTTGLSTVPHCVSHCSNACVSSALPGMPGVVPDAAGADEAEERRGDFEAVMRTVNPYMRSTMAKKKRVG